MLREIESLAQNEQIKIIVVQVAQTIKIAGFCVQKIKIVFFFTIIFIANSVCYATCNEGEVNMSFYADAFKGHAVFVWKTPFSYSFAWLAGRDAWISRKAVSNTQQVSECVVTERIKKLKGLKQTIRLFLIEDPHSDNFKNKNNNSMSSKGDFLDLINRLEALTEENQVEFIIHDSQNYKSTPEGF